MNLNNLILMLLSSLILCSMESITKWTLTGKKTMGLIECASVIERSPETYIYNLYDPNETFLGTLYYEPFKYRASGNGVLTQLDEPRATFHYNEGVKAAEVSKIIRAWNSKIAQHLVFNRS